MVRVLFDVVERFVRFGLIPASVVAKPASRLDPAPCRPGDDGGYVCPVNLDPSSSGVGNPAPGATKVDPLGLVDDPSRMDSSGGGRAE